MLWYFSDLLIFCAPVKKYFFLDIDFDRYFFNQLGDFFIQIESSQRNLKLRQNKTLNFAKKKALEVFEYCNVHRIITALPPIFSLECNQLRSLGCGIKKEFEWLTFFFFNPFNFFLCDSGKRDLDL